MNNAKKQTKQKFTGVQKRSTYSEMKESEDKTKTFVVMLKNNPDILKYFTKKNVLERTPELAKIIVWTEQYARKEHTRSPLYFIVEKYKNDGKFKHASAQKEIKELIQKSISYIKNTNSKEYEAVLKVLENVNKKEIDTDKVFRNKEWYRSLVKTLGAMGIGAYLMGRAFWAVPETMPEPVVEEIQIEDDSCEKSLDLCLSSLNVIELPPEVITRKVKVTKMPDKDEYCKEFLDEIDELRKLYGKDEKELLARIDELKNELNKEKSKDHQVTLKLHLLKKLDEKFSVTDKDGYKIYYEKYREKWANRLNNNDKAAYVTLIMLGDYFMVPHMKDGVVQGLYGHGKKMPNGEIADIRDSIRKGDYVYIAGIWYKNNMPGTTKSFIDVVERIYNYYKKSYENNSWDGKLE